MCSRRSDPFYIGSYYIKWVTNSWTYSTLEFNLWKTLDSIFKDVISYTYKGPELFIIVCLHVFQDKIYYERQEKFSASRVQVQQCQITRAT